MGNSTCGLLNGVSYIRQVLVKLLIISQIVDNILIANSLLERKAVKGIVWDTHFIAKAVV